jgi:hypothetical protein
MAAMAEDAAALELSSTDFATMHRHGVVRTIFAHLPLDARLRCAEVARPWRATCDEPSLWLRLDLSEASGGLARPANDALLRAAIQRARGGLLALDVSDSDITFGALLAVVAASPALRELRACGQDKHLSGDETNTLLQAAPQLQLLDAAVACRPSEASLLLRSAAAAGGALRVRRLAITFEIELASWHAVLSGTARAAAMLGQLPAPLPPDTDADFVRAVAADAASCDWLEQLSLLQAPLETPATLSSVVDAALTRELRVLELAGCGLCAASAPQLARLLREGALTTLRIEDGADIADAVPVADYEPQPLLDEPAAALWCSALRSNRTLTTLALTNVDFWHHPAAGVALLGALAGHPSLRSLTLREGEDDAAPPLAGAAGAALGALAAANSAALQTLFLESRHGLNDTMLGPLVDALAYNTHLLSLHLMCCRVSVEFARNRLLPALAANASLRKVLLVPAAAGSAVDALLHEAEQLVADRVLPSARG